MSGIRSRGRRGNVVVPNWRTEDRSLDPYAFRIACWLASHADRYTEKSVSRNLIAKVLNISGTKVSSALGDLTEQGIVAVEAVGERGRFIITFDFDAWETDWSRGDQSSFPTGHVATRSGHEATGTKGHSVEEQKPPAPASPKTEAHRIVDAWWDTLTPKPAQPYIAIVKVVQQCLKNGWSDELIASALREAPVVSGAAFDLWRNNREARSADEPWITELLALSAPFFDGRDLLTWRHANVEALRATIRTLGHWGFDRGETMIRIAVAARHPQDMTNPTKLAKLPRIDRFKGLPDDLSDAMERAYRNLAWRAS
ncbi:MAG TPA: hypothetical protein PKW35_10390 [Nannocystaceae bacterium]|nr:hypothetical protein [Nannocystaceae bacterium]